MFQVPRHRYSGYDEKLFYLLKYSYYRFKFKVCYVLKKLSPIPGTRISFWHKKMGDNFYTYALDFILERMIVTSATYDLRALNCIGQKKFSKRVYLAYLL